MLIYELPRRFREATDKASETKHIFIYIRNMLL